MEFVLVKRLFVIFVDAEVEAYSVNRDALCEDTNFFV